MLKYFKIWKMNVWSEKLLLVFLNYFIILFIFKNSKPLMQENYDLNKDLLSIRVYDSFLKFDISSNCILKKKQVGVDLKRSSIVKFQIIF